ncbi:geminin-like [Saccostrea echinata]|uniref:geminin-like n=1 Tax=Saccostrea echinata TaxID=191078 RepID=UPI002A841D99|nr:geminin-like [Saccostrea echinata]
MEIARNIESQENLCPFKSSHKEKMNKDSDQLQGSRKIFQTLQCSAQNPQKLIGQTGQASTTKKKVTKLIPLKEPLTVYNDPKNERTFDHKAVQTERNRRLKSLGSVDEDIDDEAYELMVSEEVPESYWKELAEQRRVALNDSLHENEMLHKEVEDLREENSKLAEMAEKADYFADVIQTMLGTDEEKPKEEGDNPDKEPESNNEQIASGETEITSPEDKEQESSRVDKPEPLTTDSTQSKE